MIGLLQRVTEASASSGNELLGKIDAGLLVFIGVERLDTEVQADRLLQRLLSYRVFADDDDKMNRSLADTQGGLLLIPQFTLPADTRKGTRPGFSTAADPADGERLYNHLLEQARLRAPELGISVAGGRFGADMQIALVNDGPVTFWLQASPR